MTATTRPPEVGRSTALPPATQDTPIRRRTRPSSPVVRLAALERKVDDLLEHFVGQEALRQFSAVEAWDPGSISDNDVAEADVGVTGVRPGDICLASFDQMAGTNALISAHVEEDDVVHVVLLNKSDSAWNPAAGNLYVQVLPREETG